MPNIPVPAAATGLPANLIAFPADRARPPAPFAADEWSRLFVATRVADQFREMSPGRACAAIVEMIEDFGAASVARILEDNAGAMSGLRAVLASLQEADRRIAAAADRALASEGL